MATYSERTIVDKVDSPLLEPRKCEPRCCWHFGIGRRVCCRCGSVRVEKPQDRAEAR